MTYRVLILAAALLAAVPASAQNAEGRWRATALAPGGEEVVMVFNFEVSGNDLTGTISMGTLFGVPIDEGMVNGNQISFQQTMQGRGGGSGTLTLNYTGTVSGDEIAFTRVSSTGGGSGDGDRGGRGGGGRGGRGGGGDLRDEVEFTAERVQ